MDANTDPARNPMTHTQFRALMDRVFLSITNENWPVQHSAKFSEWRYTSEAFIPPFAFHMRWHGGDTLTEDQETQLRALQAFGHVRPLTFARQDGEQFQETHLVVFDMLPQPKPAAMFHATPTKNLDSILACGLALQRGFGECR